MGRAYRPLLRAREAARAHNGRVTLEPLAWASVTAMEDVMAPQTRFPFADSAALLLAHWPYLLLLLLMWAGMAGVLARGMGYHRFFRDDLRLFPDATAGTGRGDAPGMAAQDLPPPARRIWVSAAFWAHFGAAALAATIWIAVHANATLVCAAARAACAHAFWRPEPFALDTPLRALVVAILAASVVALACSLAELRRPLANRRDDGGDLLRLSPGRIAAELGRGAAGAAAGAAAALAVLMLALWLRVRFATPEVSAFRGFLLFAVPAMAAILLANASPKRLPVISLTGLFLGIVLIAAAMAIGLSGRSGVTDGWGPVMAVVALALLWWLNGEDFKYRVPGFPDEAYARPFVRPDGAPRGGPGDGTPVAGHPGALDPIDALAAWHRRATGGDPGRRPVLVLLATSGGAYRATFWTALLLDKLARHDRPGDDFPDLTANIRLVTGASGGMVAGAYFAAMRADGDGGSVVARIEADVAAHQASPEGGNRRVIVPRDSLSAVLQQAVRRDLPRLFLPGRIARDRGTVLDAQWRTLGRTFAAMRPKEAEGVAPSIILSPMLVETGAPAFFSNLDLSCVRVDGRGQGQNRESVEVFAAFPAAWEHAAGGVTLATAVRLNATFPYVSPAASLPTTPAKRRLVDAGYYDNYGVDIATAFLQAERVRDWVVRHCAGVAILQARAFPTDKPVARPSRIARALHFLTSPAEALFRARAASQLFRNDQQLRLVQRAYDAHHALVHGAPCRRFVETFVFEAPVEASMSWTLTDDEIRAMDSVLDRARNGGPSPREANRSEREADFAAIKQREVTRQYRRLKAFWRVRSRRTAPPPPAPSRRARRAEPVA